MHSILLRPTGIAMMAGFAIGFAVWWSNPRRAQNRAFARFSVHLGTWLAAVLWAGYSPYTGLWKLQLTIAIGALCPLHFWIIQEVGATERPVWSIIRQRWWVIAAVFVTAAFPFTDWFIPPSSTPEHRIYSAGYYTYVIVEMLFYAAVLWRTIRIARGLTDIRRIELEITGGVGAAAAITVHLLMGLTAVTRNPVWVQLQPFVVIIWYGSIYFAIARYRVFDARQTVRAGVSRLILILVVGASQWVIFLALGFTGAPMAVRVLGAGAAGIGVFWTMVGAIKRVFYQAPRQNEIRETLIRAAFPGTPVPELTHTVERILCEYWDCDRAIILRGGLDGVEASGIQLAAGSPVLSCIRSIGWATPERFLRERLVGGRAQTREFLIEHRLGALVAAEGPAHVVLIGLGYQASQLPFTYPSIAALLDLATLIENILARAQLTQRAQRAEQLAAVGTLGASVAHEIRNPLVAVRTFLQLLPPRIGDKVFAQTYIPAVNEEIARIDALATQLLQLAEPRRFSAQRFDLHETLTQTVRLIGPKAEAAGVKITTDFGATSAVAHSSPDAIKQVALNLCLNAIDAMAENVRERSIIISTADRSGPLEFSVEDTGRGIVPSERARLFQPFHTTKSHGFGLGLAICRDILSSLSATIRVDNFEEGKGAVFRVTLPAVRSSTVELPRESRPVESPISHYA